MSNTTNDSRAEDQARVQYESIASMIAAVDLDWIRLEELRDARSDYVADNPGTPDYEARAMWANQNPDDAAELAELEEAAGVWADSDDVERAIDENPLSVEVRSGWQSIGEQLTAEEFAILLCTGGPAVRIRGELDHNGDPCRAWIEYQDWGTPWTQLFGVDSDPLIRYAARFIFPC